MKTLIIRCLPLNDSFLLREDVIGPDEIRKLLKPYVADYGYKIIEPEFVSARVKREYLPQCEAQGIMNGFFCDYTPVWFCELKYDQESVSAVWNIVYETYSGMAYWISNGVEEKSLPPKQVRSELYRNRDAKTGAVQIICRRCQVNSKILSRVVKRPWWKPWRCDVVEEYQDPSVPVTLTVITDVAIDATGDRSKEMLLPVLYYGKSEVFETSSPD